MAIKKGSPDFVLFFTTLALLGIGIVMVFSASAVKAYQVYHDSFYFLKKQLMWSVVGFVGMIFGMRFNYKLFQRLAKPALIIVLLLLVAVLIPGIGKVVGGARRWVGVGPFTFQPSELAKLAMVIFMAKYLSQNQNRVKNFFEGIVIPFGLFGIIFALIMLEPDLGTSIAIGGTVFTMVFVAGANAWQLGGIMSMAIPVVGLLVWLEPYRMKRILAFVDPWKDPLGYGFHIIQSLYALGSGGFLGLGLGRSRQKFFYLPENHTDFIFAILGEELGFIGAATVLGLFFLFAWRGFKIAMSASDSFSTLLATGITTMITLQAIINIGVVTSSMPITGIPLPFISFGGSSLVFTLFGVGLLLGISREAKLGAR